MATRGRKSRAEDWLSGDNLILIKGWARDGLTDEQIAHNIGIAKSTLYEWKKKYKDFSDTLKESKEVVDRQVENALLKRALGYDYDEEKSVTIQKSDGSFEERFERITKHVSPDTTAQIFWLKNRKPEEWRDKREGVVSVIDDDTRGKISNLLDEAKKSGE